MLAVSIERLLNWHMSILLPLLLLLHTSSLVVELPF
jgi:hypothetical protein